MCNCGSKREIFKSTNSKENSPATTASAYFEYTGLSGLAVIGAASGKRYRFKQTGAVELIDPRDVSGMMSVPVLKRIKRDDA